MTTARSVEREFAKTYSTYPDWKLSIMHSNIIGRAVLLLLLFGSWCCEKYIISKKRKCNNCTFASSPLIGILMCRDVCVQTVGCKSYSYRKETFWCDLHNISANQVGPCMKHTTTDVNKTQTKGWRGFKTNACKLSSKIIVSKKNTCKCVEEGYVTVSHKYSDIIYGHTKDIPMIDPVVILSTACTKEARQVLLTMNGLVTKHKFLTIYGMTAGHCNNKKKYCIYFLCYHRQIAKKTYRIDVVLIAIEEPHMQKQRQRVELSARQKLSFPKIQSVYCISLDGHLNLYILLSTPTYSEIFCFTNTNGSYRKEVETRRIQYQVFAMDVMDNGEKFIVFAKKRIRVVERNEVTRRGKTLTYLLHTWDRVVCFMRSEGILSLVKRKHPHHVKLRHFRK